jgi:gluconate kinase
MVNVLNYTESFLSKKTTMVSELKDSRVGHKISKSLIESEANFLQNPEDYHQYIQVKI